MQPFHYHNQQLYAEDVAIQDIASAVGTPSYLYSQAAIEGQWNLFDTGFGTYPHLICYAVKANSNLAILALLAELGSGFDIVSIGELERVLTAGGDPAKIVFSGVGKSRPEIERALKVGIHCFNVESPAELVRVEKIAQSLGVQAPISIRVNPDVDAQSHPYISTGMQKNKFGVPIQQSQELFEYAQNSSHLQVRGIDCHIGSQLVEMSPYLDALDRVLELVSKLHAQGICLNHIDMGGGVGICYQTEHPINPAEFSAALVTRIQPTGLEILIEPGRAIVGNSGVLITRVEYLKSTPVKNFAIVDAAMNDLLRPALYQAWQQIQPTFRREGPQTCYDVVGPICETGDFLALERSLCIEPDDILAIGGAGAYGFVMSSNYNSRPRAAEVLVQGNQFHIVRERESISSLFANEHFPSKNKSSQ